VVRGDERWRGAVLEIDIERSFDTIDHAKLMEGDGGRLSRLPSRCHFDITEQGIVVVTPVSLMAFLHRFHFNMRDRGSARSLRRNPR
jgi:hypothetical protein